MGHWSQTRDGWGFPAQTTAKFNCILVSQYEYIHWLCPNQSSGFLFFCLSVVVNTLNYILQNSLGIYVVKRRRATWWRLLNNTSPDFSVNRTLQFGKYGAVGGTEAAGFRS